MRDVGSRRGHACEEAGYGQEISIPSSLCCEAKTTLKKSNLFLGDPELGMREGDDQGSPWLSD